MANTTAEIEVKKEEDRFFEWQFYECLGQYLVEVFVFAVSKFALVYLFGHWSAVRSPFARPKLRFFFEATLLSFYGNLFVVLSVIWKLHQHLSYRALAQLFLALSHAEVLKGFYFLLFHTRI